MEIKLILKQVKKSFDRIILLVMVIVLVLLLFRYTGVVRQKSATFGEKDMYAVIGIPWRTRNDIGNEVSFIENLNKRVDIILGIKPSGFYKKIIYRNPFSPVKDLVIEPFSLKPAVFKIGIGEKARFEPLNGIGPYAWKCEPENLGIFKDSEFTAGALGSGRIIVTDARGYTAATETMEVISRIDTSVAPPPVKEEKKIIYKGIMKMAVGGVPQTFAIIEEKSSGMTHFKKTGEEVAGFVVKDVTQEKLTLFDKDKNKEMELMRE